MKGQMSPCMLIPLGVSVGNLEPLPQSDQRHVESAPTPNVKSAPLFHPTPVNEGVYGLTRIFTPLSTYHSVVVYAHLVDVVAY